jgi:hypothetical protein
VPNIPLLEPLVIREVVQLLPVPETLALSSALPRSANPFPTVTWDIIRGSRTVGKPNVPNAEAHIVPRLGRSQKSASFIYFREKKVFSPTTLHWIRALGQTGSLQNAEDAIMREVTELNTRCDNLVEWACWQAMSGTLAFTYPDVAGSIDYDFRSTHKPTAGVAWSSATAMNIVNDIIAWKRLIQRDARVPAKEAWSTEVTMQRIFNAFATGATSSAAGLLSDNMKDQFYKTGILPGFMGLDWRTVEGQYDTDTGSTALFLPDGALALTNLTDGRPMELLNGPTADDQAPNGFTGKFTKTWQEEDPSARQILLELNFLPIITKPDQIVYVSNVG